MRTELLHVASTSAVNRKQEKKGATHTHCGFWDGPRLMDGATGAEFNTRNRSESSQLHARDISSVTRKTS
jgi:hypothetical protein